jgi:hypothetical protein
LDAEIGLETEDPYWEPFWRDFSRVKYGKLLVEILDCGVTMPDRALLEPLYQVEAGSMEVLLPYRSGIDDSDRFEDAPFVVKRPSRAMICIAYWSELSQNGPSPIRAGRPLLVPKTKRLDWANT